MSALASFLKCASCRYAALYFMPFAVGALAARPSQVGWVLAGVPLWMLFSLGTELVNRLSDRAEDAINRPERTRECDRVGFDRLRLYTVAIWLAVAAIDVAWVAVRPSTALAILLFLALLCGINYSVGLRFKRHPYPALVVLSFLFGGPFLIGYAVHGSNPAGAEQDFMHLAGPASFVLALFVVTLAGAKDVTDAEGDRAIGYDSPWVRLVQSAGLVAPYVLASVPFIALAAFVATGTLPPRFGALLAIWPFSCAIILAGRGAVTPAQRHAVRELGYHYWLVFAAVALFLYWPDYRTVLIVAASTAYWVTASQFLHWSGGVSADTLRAFAGAVRRSGRPSRSAEGTA